ncbi:MAG: helix-turn-helix domain-containing protein [Leptolyngbyaceae cyanobacterium CSU_1_4]|nr:helix-turn-helix domain-containing protein [Leptolyngbyaceae cyanobacterium CSU_1_4]
MTTEISLLQRNEQAEQLTQIGSYLRQIREENLLSLEEVSTKTLIQPRLLRAIETGKLQQLPEPVYIQGFIKRYAEALGLDGTQFAEAFPVEGNARQVESSWNDSAAAQLRPLHLYVAYVGLIVASVSLLSYVVNRSAPVPGGVTRLEASPSNVQSSPSSAEKRVDSQTIASRPTADKPVRINVKLTAQSWLQVEVDGQPDYEGVLAEGTERSWSAKSLIRVRSGNAGGVMVGYNGKQAKPMGDPGAVEEKVFSVSQDSASLPDSATVPIP